MTDTMTTVRELLAHYIENHEYGIKQNTIDCWCKPGVSKFERWLERPSLISDLNLPTVNAYVDWLKANSSSTEAARSRRGPLLLLVRYANDLGLVPKFEGRIRKIRITRKTPRGWTSAEVQKLLKRCLDETVIKKTAKAGEIHHNSRNANVLRCGTRVGLFLAGVVAVAWDSTLRLGDVLELRWADLMIAEDGTARAQVTMSKTGYIQPITLTAETVSLLRDIQDSRITPSEKCLDWEHRREKFYDWLRAYVREAGLQGSMKFVRKGSASAAENLCRGAGKASLGHRSDWVSAAHYLVPEIVGQTDIVKPSLFREAEPTVQPATSNDLTPEEQAMLAMFRGRRQA